MTYNQTVTPELPNDSLQAEGRENAIRLAAEWLSKNRAECPQPIIPTLRNRFDLSAKEAINAITQSHQINCGRVANLATRCDDGFSGLTAREKQVVAVLVQRRALQMIAPTCDEISKLSRLARKVVRATIDDLLTKGVVQPTVHGRTHQARYKLVEFGGASQ